MKIQIVMNFALPVPPLLGGAVEKRWYGVAQVLGRDHDVAMISCRHPDLAERESVAGISHVRLPGFDWSNRQAINLWRSSRWCLRVARRLQPADILVTNDVMAPVLLPRLRSNLGKVCIDVQRMPKAQHRWLYGRADRFYCTSSAVLDEMRRVAPRRLDQCRLMPNPTDVDCYAPNTSTRHGDRCEVLYVGRIHAEKGLDRLLRAWPHCRYRRKMFLRLVGPAAERSGGDPAFADHLRSLAATLGISPDEWSLDPPVFNESELADIYRRGDIFVYPSQALRGETFGVSVLEAMACGKPCVVSSLACFRDLVQTGENGLVVLEDTPEAWAASLDQLVAEEDVRRRMGSQSRALALTFSRENIAARMVDDFHALLHGAPPVARVTVPSGLLP